MNLSRGIAVVALAFFAAACSQAPKRTNPWNDAKKVTVGATEDWKLEQGDIAVLVKMKRHPKGMELALEITSKGPRLAYADVRGFWDNEELAIRGVSSGEMRAEGDDEKWIAKVKLAGSVHKWPEKDIVYLGVGKALWHLTVLP